ncbi:MAG: hypothetical protein IT223_07840 [Crocinitomicaceae bacterium]|nr:hypothetical protein [Crocinitomicaceae bacterium]
MKHFLLSLFLLLMAAATMQAQPGGVSINTSGQNPHPSAMIDISSTTKGALIPRMAENERDAISNPAEGLLIFNTSSKCFNVYKNSNWFELCGNCIAPPAPVTGGDVTICEGNNLSLSASSSPGSAYQWSSNTGFSSSDQYPAINPVTSADAGTYSVTATLNGCTSAASTLNIFVVPLPTTANAGPDQINLAGTTATLAANTAIAGNPQWSIISGNGGNVASPTTPTSSFSGQLGESYILRWTITNSCGTSYDEVTISFAAGGPKKVFMTSTTYNANLGGISGANAKCQTRAAAAGLTGTWKAWISTSSSSPSTSFTQSAYPYQLVDGTQVAANWADLTDGSIGTVINKNEFGSTVSFNGPGSYSGCGSWAGGYFIMAWSATKANGTFNPVNPSYPTCSTTWSDWMSTSGGGDIWIQWNNQNTANCGESSYHLMCFEQ